MTIASSSVVTGVPTRFRGLRVLLIVSDQSSLQHHAHILSQFSNDVTCTTTTASGLSMIRNGKIFECALVDADTCEMALVDFLDQILKLKPELSIIMMASSDVHMRIAKDHQENEAILWLHKPFALSDFCNIWQHICRKRTEFQQDHSNGMFLEENHAIHIDDRVDNNISCTVTHKRVTREDVHCDDDHHQQHIAGNYIQSVIRTATAQKADKGKQPLEMQSEKNQPNEGAKSRKKRKVVEKRFTWSPDLHAKFLEAVRELGEQKAYPSAIHKQMNEPSLKRNNVMSHLQNFRERGNAYKASNIDPPMQRGNILDVESCAWKRSWQSTPSNENASVNNSSKLVRPENLNFYGISYMTIDNIKARLQEAPPLPTPQVTTTFDGVKGSDNNLSKPQQPLIGKTCMSTTFGLVENTPSGGQYNEVQLTSNGISYMTIDNINARLQEAPPLPTPLVTRTFDGVKGTDKNLSEPQQPLIGKTCMSTTVGLVENSPSGGQYNEVQLTNYGISYMTLDNIKARLQEAPPLPTPLVTTTFDGVKGTDNNLSEPQQPLIGKTCTSTTFGLVENFPSGGRYNEVQLTNYGISCMTIDNIKARLQEAPPLPTTLVTPTFDGVKGTDNNLSEPQQPLIGKTCMSTTFGLGENSPSGVQYSEVQLTSNGYGNVMEQLITGDHSSDHAKSSAHTPLVTTTFDGVKETDNNLSEPQQPLIGKTCMSTTFGLGENSPSGGQYNDVQLTSYGFGNEMEQMITGDHSLNHANDFSNGFYDGNSIGGVCGGVSETQEPFDCFGIATEPLVAVGGDSEFSSNHNVEEAMTLSSVVTAVQSDYNLGMHTNDFWNSFANGNSEGAGGSGVSETLVQFDGFGIEPDPWVAGGGVTNASSDYGPEDLAPFPESLCQSDDVFGNKENLFPNLPPSMNLLDHDILLNPINSDIYFTPAEEYNSQDHQILTSGSSIINPLDGSEGGVVDDDLFLNHSRDFQIVMELLDEGNVDLINGPW